jgi:hypothetical protein
MSSLNTIQISNISSETSDEELRNFFSFCGKIDHLSVDTNASPKSATIRFENDTAATTALLLDHTQLGGNQVHVTLRATTTAVDGGAKTKQSGDTSGNSGTGTDSYRFAQSDKPRTRIFAEYLAHGYHITDLIVAKGIELDKRHGFTAKFKGALEDFNAKYSTFDAKHHTSERAKVADERYHVTRQATQAWNSIDSYFDKVMGTPRGRKLRRFYEEHNKEVRDVHTEARHLADLKAGKHHQHNAGSYPSHVVGDNNLNEEGRNVESVVCKCRSDVAHCPCPAKTCDCSNCGKSSGAEVSNV